MKFDLFLSLCQAKVNSRIPSERQMYENFFDQVQWGDSLGFEVAWVGESHFSSEVQKRNPNPVIPNFQGEVSLNSDVLHLAHKIFNKTKKIEVGSAIKNILAMGGPLAHAEAVKMFLAMHGLDQHEDRKIHVGFASGRFPFSNQPYGIKPRTDFEQSAWPIIKGKVLAEATEIFLRGLGNEAFSSEDIQRQYLERSDCKNDQQWQELQKLYKNQGQLMELPERIKLTPFWNFETLAIWPFEARMDLLRLVLGSYDPRVQTLANQFAPCGVFNLSITEPAIIEKTHTHMKSCYHKAGGPWKREYMPRTSLVFIEDSPQLSSKQLNQRAQERAKHVFSNYIKAMQGTISQQKIDESLEYALCGCPDTVAEQIRSRFHIDDRLMLWFDFYCHDNEFVKQQMKTFCDKVIPKLSH